MTNSRCESLPTIEECQARFLERVAPITEMCTVPLLESLGLVAAEDIASGMNVPPFAKSAMDGYAVHAETLAGASAETPVRLRVMGELCAGDYAELPWNAEQPMTAVRVMTGAYIPDGYDAVVRQEDTDYGETEVSIYTEIVPYRNYCKIGEDVAAGTVLVPAGTRIGAVHIGLLAECGIAEIKVRRPLRAAILCTGSELAELGTPLTPGKIYNNLSYILEARVRGAGLEVTSRGLCADEPGEMKERIATALEQADILITTGGVSVGKKDIVRQVLESMGAELLFTRAAVQPGTPTTGAVLNGKPVLCLSGNPYAALVNFDLYFWSIAARMMECAALEPVRAMAVLQSEYPKRNHCRRFLRAYAAGGKVTLPDAVHASSVISNLTQCNCYIDLEAGREVHPGDTVTIWGFPI